MKKLIFIFILFVSFISFSSAYGIIYEDFKDGEFDATLWSSKNASADFGGLLSALRYQDEKAQLKADGNDDARLITNGTSGLNLNQNAFLFTSVQINNSGQGEPYLRIIDESGNSVNIINISSTNQSLFEFRIEVVPLLNNLTYYIDGLDGSGSPNYVDLTSLTDGDNWYLDYFAKSSGGAAMVFDIFWLNYSIGDIEVSLNFPTGQVFQKDNIIFNSSFVPIGTNLSNATLYIWNSNGTLVNNTETNIVLGNTLNETTWNITVAQFTSLGTYNWNVLANGINLTGDTIETFALNNNTFVIGNFTEEFDRFILEGQSTGINLSINFVAIDTDLLAHLVWNNTIYTPIKDIISANEVRFRSNFIVPIGTGNLTGRNVTHWWRYWLPDNSLNATTDNETQQVTSLNIDNCSALTTLLINYTMFDEETIIELDGPAQNGTIEVDVTITSISDVTQNVSFANTYNRTSVAEVCVSTIDSGFVVDSQVRYTGDDYVYEFHNIQNSSLNTFPKNISLYPLKTADSQEFLVTYKDSNFIPVSDALITLNRKYVGEGIFRNVESPLTNDDGQTLLHMVLGDVIYSIQVSKGGIVLATYENIIAVCENIATGECEINLPVFSSGTDPQDFTLKDGLNYRFELDDATRTATVFFSTVDNTLSTIRFDATVFDNRGNNTFCSNSVQTSSGSLFCTAPISVGNSTILLELFKDGNFVDRVFFDLKDNEETGFGLTGLILMAILIITIPLMFISSPVGIVIGSVIGLITAGLLNLYNDGGILGLGSTMLWFIIAGGILLWKINQLKK